MVQPNFEKLLAQSKKRSAGKTPQQLFASASPIDARSVTERLGITTSSEAGSTSARPTTSNRGPKSLSRGPRTDPQAFKSALDKLPKNATPVPRRQVQPTSSVTQSPAGSPSPTGSLGGVGAILATQPRGGGRRGLSKRQQQFLATFGDDADAIRRTQEAQTQAQEAAEGIVGEQVAADEAARQKRSREFDEFKQAQQEKLTKLQTFADRIAASSINPDRIYSGETGKAIGSSIALAMGAIGSSFARIPNFAMQQIENSINRDIEAQVQNVGNLRAGFQAQQGALGQAAQLFETEQEQREALRSIAWEGVKAKIGQAAQRATTAEQVEKLNMMNNEIVRKQSQLQQRFLAAGRPRQKFLVKLANGQTIPVDSIKEAIKLRQSESKLALSAQKIGQQQADKAERKREKLEARSVRGFPGAAPTVKAASKFREIRAANRDTIRKLEEAIKIRKAQNKSGAIVGTLRRVVPGTPDHIRLREIQSDIFANERKGQQAGAALAGPEVANIKVKVPQLTRLNLIGGDIRSAQNRIKDIKASEQAIAEELGLTGSTPTRRGRASQAFVRKR